MHPEVGRRHGDEIDGHRVDRNRRRYRARLDTPPTPIEFLVGTGLNALGSGLIM
ncbi:MAG: hypothetical protein QGI10_00505 [Vicinamibacterales bacterium]|nr:hypothetical protein [Vicinamibacterales bacterium]MDP7477726.1 hypothetical protein [Vicinamibacterales bacterium]HJN46644.1 hypothetical protein [Vicinamibacterales bacterium]